MNNIHDVYGRNLDLNLLRVFAVVADEGSVTRAASRLYITQPAVSAALRRFAAFVGSELFARQGRGIVLTSRGAELLVAARAHLAPLVAATMVAPAFDPKASKEAVRVGLADGMEALILPNLLRLLRAEAPGIQLVVLPAQFRTVEELLLSNKVAMAVSVADELPRSILRQPLKLGAHSVGGFVCLYDPRFTKLAKKKLTEKEYFARDHVLVSYAADLRGIIEDALGKSRNVRVSVPAFSHVDEVVDGSPLLATIPRVLAEHILKTRPHLRFAPLPFSLKGGAGLDLLWARASDEDVVARFVRGLVTRAAAHESAGAGSRGSGSRA